MLAANYWRIKLILSHYLCNLVLKWSTTAIHQWGCCQCWLLAKYSEVALFTITTAEKYSWMQTIGLYTLFKKSVNTHRGKHTISMCELW